MPGWLTVKSLPGGTTLELSGSWRLTKLVEIEGEISTVRIPPQIALKIDGRNIEEMDTAGAMALLRLIGWPRGGADKSGVEFVGFEESTQRMLTLVCESYNRPAQRERVRRRNVVTRIGVGTSELATVIFRLVSFVGETISAIGQAILRPRSLRLRELFVQLESGCIDAIPIVALVTFLIGVVVAYLFGAQIEKYGGNIFIVDAAGLAMCRELSPILVAIIVAGRSGSAFTAQIGTMKLNEEIDAMVTLGLSPMQVLVLPRVFALMLAMPLLVFVGDVVGICGSMLIADLRLGVTGVTFLERLRVVLPERAVFVGLVKAPIFALFIGIIGCHMGMSVENNARSVGLSTTATVVRSIVAVILLNAGFAIMFMELGI